MRATPVFKAL